MCHKFAGYYFMLTWESIYKRDMLLLYGSNPVRSSMCTVNIKQMYGEQISFPFSPPRKVMSGQHWHISSIDQWH